MKRFAVFLFFICAMIQMPGYGQAIDTSLLKHKFRSYLLNNFQEKIYIHTDKNSYLAGETIWLKIYNIEAYTNHKVNVSKIVYVELLDAQHKPVVQLKVPLNNGTGSGYVSLPSSLPSGNFLLRAYSSWMKNFDADYFFHKELTIHNAIKEEAVTVKNTLEKAPSIQFFPEGGNLVSGLTSKIGFKGVDDTGKGLGFKGFVLDDNNDTLAKFTPFKFGLGHFYFKPVSGKTYKVKIQPETGQAFYTKLPMAFEKGVVMQVKTQQDTLLYVSLQNNLDKKENFTLFVHSGQKVIGVYKMDVNQSRSEVTLPLRKFGDGISHLSLFNAAGEPICERLYFKKPSSILKVSVSTEQQLFATRTGVKISVSQTQYAKPISSDFSVSVYKSDNDEYDEDIATSLWLTSELKGKIENASWYLDDAPPIAADNLMLTHGWRRFLWKDALTENKKAFEYLAEIQGPVVSGKVINMRTGLNMSDVSGFLSVPGRNFQFHTATSNKDGRVDFYLRKFYGDHKIIAQTDVRIDSFARVIIQNPFSEKIAEYNSSRFNNYPDTSTLLKRSVALQVNNAYYGRFINQETKPVTDSTFFYKEADKRYKLDDYVRFTKMEDVLREYVFEIDVALRKKNYHLSLFDKGTNSFFSSSPLVLADGLPLFDDGNSIVGVDARNIKNLEIVTDSYNYGSHTFSGIASFQTYNGDLAGLTIPAHATAINYIGLQYKKEFYAPMYEGDLAKRSRLADFRTTLLWSPENKTNDLGEAVLDFFTSDLEGDFTVVVKSLADNGAAGQGGHSFRVQKTMP